ncbi:SitI6 family double-CXXCG motif immunity protein [Myxococcus faecalis]|uniref:SitI6 family double-CXXCG motif immunity protein n=1 Tax=Myxococcus faecalis TaxID=3115646 RepID=UPI003CF6BF7C
MTYYEVQSSPASRWSGTLRAKRRWALPGLEDCPGCHATWSGVLEYPAVDLSDLPEAHELEEVRPEHWPEYSRLLELVRPYCPPGAHLEPGTGFGPLVGSARGKWGPVTLVDIASLLVREDAIHTLSGLNLTYVWPQLRRPPSPRIAEIHLAPLGRLAPECSQSDQETPCAVCGRDGGLLPQHYWLDAASIPADTDAFRLTDAATLVIVSGRMADRINDLGDSDIMLTPIGTTKPPNFQPPKPLNADGVGIVIRRAPSDI